MTSSNKEVDEEPAHPVDRGWAWVVLLGCTINFILIVGTLKAFGIYFVEFVAIYKAGVSMTSSIAGLLQAFYSLASLPIMMIALQRLSSRQLAMIGGLFGTVAYVAGSFAPSVAFLLFSNGILYGIAFGCIHGPCAYLIGVYFVKRRSLANAIVVAGGSFGGLILPPIYRFLLDNFNLQGALLITAGLIFHIQVGAALLRPPGVYRKSQTHKNNEQNYLKESSTLGHNDQSKKLLTPEHKTMVNGFYKDRNYKNSNLFVNNDSCLKSNHTDFTKMLCSDEATINNSHDCIPSSHTLAVKNFRRQHQIHGSSRSVVERKLHNDVHGSHKSYLDKITNSSFSVYASYGDLYTSSLLELSQQQADRDILSAEEKDFDEKQSCWSSLNIDMSVLKNPSMILYLFVYCLGSVGCAYGHIYIPAYARDKGIDNQKISYMVSTISGCDFAGRLLCGVIADRNIMKNTSLVICTLLIAGIFMEFSYFYKEFWTFMLFSVAHGLFAGGIFALTPAILADLLGMENFRSSQGICIFSQGFTMGSSAPFIGYLRDVTGDYNASFQFMGVCLILPAFVLLARPMIERRFNAQTQSFEASV